MHRSSGLVVLAAAFVTLAAPEPARAEPKKESRHKALTTVNPQFMVTPEEAFYWHLFKDMGGPTFSGSPSWQRYLGFLEEKLGAFGVVGLERNAWSYQRWSTTEWPDSSSWTLSVEGAPVRVASYGAYSGSTGPEGITAPLALYDAAAPAESYAGKIVVFRTAPHPLPPFTPQYKAMYTTNDYEYRTDGETFTPLFESQPVSTTVSSDVWYQLGQVGGFIARAKALRAAGAVFVFDFSYDRLAGLYTFGVPTPYDVPSLYVDRVAGAGLVADAQAQKTANLKLLSTVEPADTWQLIGYLPGKDFGTAADQKVLLISHTDGPAISQENGGFGVLGIVHYFSRIPQPQRPRTLMILLDNRHYMPGMERAFAAYDWFARHPEAAASVVASIGTEHLGQIEHREIGDRFEPTGLPEPSFLWARNNPLLIEMAIDAVQELGWPRVQVQCPERPGIHGLPQGVWYGMGSIASTLRIPGFATMGTQGAYWATTARITKFDPDLFIKQVAVMAKLTGKLMVADLVAIDPVWGMLRTAIAGLPDAAFVDPSLAAAQRAALLQITDAAFAEVKEGARADAAAMLELELAPLAGSALVAGTARDGILGYVATGLAKLGATP